MSTENERESQIDPVKELQKWADAAPPTSGRKLTFSEKCGIAWALKTKGARARDVMEAFALSAATVSWLKHALQPGRKHYRDVWEELQRLGAERFAEKHFTLDLYWRLKRVRDNLTHLDETGTDRAVRLFAPDPHAKKYAGQIPLPDGSQWVVELRQNIDPPGWYFAGEDGVWHGAESLRGAEGHEPFARSEYAFDAVHERNGYDSPRLKPGRPRK